MLGNDRPNLPPDRPTVTQTISHEFMLSVGGADEDDLNHFESILEEEVASLEQIFNAIFWIQKNSHGWDIHCMPANSDVDDDVAQKYLRESLQRMQSELFQKLEQEGQLTVEDL